jgi:hypothetical protein
LELGKFGNKGMTSSSTEPVPPSELGRYDSSTRPLRRPPECLKRRSFLFLIPSNCLANSFLFRALGAAVSSFCFLALLILYSCTIFINKACAAGASPAIFSQKILQ